MVKDGSPRRPHPTPRSGSVGDDVARSGGHAVPTATVQTGDGPSPLLVTPAGGKSRDAFSFGYDALFRSISPHGQLSFISTRLLSAYFDLVQLSHRVLLN